MEQQPIKLSEAMRAGAKQHPQAYGRFFEKDERGNVVATCALGAAFVGVGGDPNVYVQEGNTDSVLDVLEGRCNVDFHREINDPLAYKGHRTLVCAIYGRNDRGAGMTREEIADWLESIGF